ncbi:bifunctional (p)ppGpp synthetase/guanosine-3',5'-bis(diphosphate) 3'-pyrophosphohydrolase [Candidatus Poribacteria bacterium]|nr:bifunctional (p)ppGpp synthetase/guanosine-3',5'-bis(diphosphate) 3'-pyrophosphohydrolase [Candidatus Poribacteria bacterium]
MEINELIQKIHSIHPDTDTTLVRLAYNIATKNHEGQLRVSGIPYLTHAMEVANILVDLKLDLITVAAGLLHDVVEDTKVSIEEIKDNLGEEIALLVAGVTKISAIQFKSIEEQQVENLRKMFLAMAKDSRVILIKLADRTHNMRTLEFLSSEKQQRISRETIEVYAPLANRLGIGKIKNELEDLCFKYLYPEDYKSINQTVEQKYSAREQHIVQIKKELEEYVNELNIKASVSGRPKHLYSIYRKMKTQNKAFNEVYDLIAFRVIAETVKDCYAILGVVHTKWPPIPGRFKDYIATPKSNMYQSLHTSIISSYGEPIEIQIRTQQMHRIAEEGIAAHWRYKEDGKIDEKLDKNIVWLRQLIEWQNELRNPHEFMDSLKIDLFKNEVFVFTPKGMVKGLPEGSTPVDFAYAIHTDIGHRCVGARVNGKMVPLKYKLKNGDIIEINTQEKHHASRDWMSFVKTSKAKSKIKQWIKQQEDQESIISGEKIFHNEIAKEIKNEEEFVQKAGDSKAASEIIVEGVEKDVIVKTARCCNPVPYDEILGFISRGRGIIIHRNNCANANKLKMEKNRLVKADWSKKTTSCFNVAVKVKAHDRVNLLKDILATIAETKIIINSASAKAVDNKMAVCSFLFEIANKEQLQYLLEKIQKIESVIKAYRVDKIE